MQSLARIKELLDLAGHPPKKALGQNFLLDQNLITKLVDGAGIDTSSFVLEVGPGTGALSEAILERGATLLAIELDSALTRVLREHVAPEYGDRFTVIEGDCLASKRAVNEHAIAVIGDKSFTLIANLPYHAATPLMMTLLTSHANCTSMHVTIQKEVVDRFAAGPGSKNYGAISVVAQVLGAVERVANLPAECFYPRPSVASAMMRWTRDEGADQTRATERAQIVQTLFQSRRKKLGGVVKRMTRSETAWPEGVSPDDRVDALNAHDVWALAAVIDAAL